MTTALSLLVVSIAFGQGGGYGQGSKGGRSGRGGRNGGHGMMGGGYGNYWNNNYTQEDYAKIDSIHQKYYPEMEKLRVSIFNKNSEIRLEMNQTKPNQSKIESLIDQESKLRADMDKLRFKIDNEIRQAIGK